MDVIAGILELIAICIVGEKNRWGWALGILCCILWIYTCCKTRSHTESSSQHPGTDA